MSTEWIQKIKNDEDKDLTLVIAHCEKLAHALKIIAECGRAARERDENDFYILTCGRQTGVALAALRLLREGKS